ncbi:hypothetical protein CR513_17946, partial [Mucuna pruriens]
MEERKIKEDMGITKEKEGEVEGEIITTFIMMKGVINPPKVIKEEDVEEILIEQMKGGMINLMLNVIIVISMCRTNVEEKVNLVGDKEEGEKPTLLLALNEESDDKSLWYLDNGSSNHMCGYKEKFVELKEKANGNVSFGDSFMAQIQRKGTILISLKNGSRKFIKDVYYVPKFRSNILSLGQVIEKMYEVLMKENCL